MSDKQMKVKVKFDNFATTLTPEEKSLANFFMKNASLFIYGNNKKASCEYDASSEMGPDGLLFTANASGEVGNTYSLEFIKNESNTGVTVTFKISNETVISGNIETELDDYSWIYGDDIQSLSNNGITIGSYITITGKDGTGYGGIEVNYIPNYGDDPLVFQLVGGDDGIFADILPEYKLAECTDTGHLPGLDSGITVYFDNLYNLGIPYTSNASTGNGVDVSNYSGIPNYKTAFVTAHSNLYIMQTSWSDSYGKKISSINLSNELCDITIEPLINNQVNTDDTLIPSSISSQNPSIISDIIFSRSSSNKDYDFQLYTSRFGLSGYYDDEVHPVYYKIGIFPIGNNAIEDIKDALSADNVTDNNKWFALYYNNGSYSRLLFNMIDRGDPIPSLYQNGDVYCLVKTNVGNNINDMYDTSEGSGNYADVANRFIMPFSDDNHNLIALLYFELFNEDGSLFDNDAFFGLSGYFGYHVHTDQSLEDDWEAGNLGYNEGMLGLDIYSIPVDGTITMHDVDSVLNYGNENG